MDDLVIQKAFEAIERGQSFAFATVVEATLKGTPRKAGAKMVVLSDGKTFGTIGGGRNEKAAVSEALKALKTGKTRTVRYDYFGKKAQSVCGGQIQVFIEPFAAKRHLVICGAGHVALPLSFLGKVLNFRVTIIDNRKELANKKRFPHADFISLGNHAQKLQDIPIDRNTFIMIVTQGNEYDYQCLKATINKDYGFLGVIASKAKRIKFLASLKKAGVPPKILKKVSIPAGIDIGAQTPEEIAVSIMAEMIRSYNSAWLATAKFKEKELSND